MARAAVASLALPHLFGADGEAALAALMQQRPLAAFDFDGTLAPIVAHPDDATMPADVAHCLARLATRLPVAIVTGRAVRDVRPRLGFEPQYVVGSHGAEDDTAPRAGADALAHALEPLRARLDAEAALLAAAGVLVEDKGLSIALHYRLAPRPDAARALIDALTATLPRTLQVFGGKMVVNAMAARAPDKAAAVRRLQARSAAASVFYAGDDLNDEPVFAAAPPHWLTLRIGRDGSASSARFGLDGIGEVVPLLERMLALAPN